MTLIVAALLPWAVWSSRLGSTWSVAPLLLLWVMGAAGRATARPSHRLWGAAGVGLGLLLTQPLPLHTPTLLWLVVLTLVAWGAQRFSRHAATDHAAVVAGSALSLGLAWLLPTWQAGGLSAASIFPTSLGDAPQLALAGLLDAGGANLTYFLAHPLLPAWVAALALVGWAALVHGLRQPRAVIVAAGALIYAVAAWTGETDARDRRTVAAAAGLYLGLSGRCRRSTLDQFRSGVGSADAAAAW